jgi:hypothetical protein
MTWGVQKLGLNFGLQAISSSGRKRREGGQAMKNLSPQNRAERRHGAERELGSKFFERPTIMPEESILIMK